MKHLSLLLFTVVASLSCSKKPVDKGPYQYYRYCLYEQHTRIDTMYNKGLQEVEYSIAPDSVHATFHYVNGRNRIDISDADFAYQIMIETDSGVNSFTYTDEQLKEHKAVYSSGGGMGGVTDYQLLQKGIISANTIGPNLWQISINVMLNHTDTKTMLSNVTDTIVTNLPTL